MTLLGITKFAFDLLNILPCPCTFQNDYPVLIPKFGWDWAIVLNIQLILGRASLVHYVFWTARHYSSQVKLQYHENFLKFRPSPKTILGKQAVQYGWYFLFWSFPLKQAIFLEGISSSIWGKLLIILNTVTFQFN